MQERQEQPILHRAHGGAWKVAYADFVTAMMALFMVLWICSQDQEILLETAKYFQSPFNSPLKQTYGVMEDGAPSYQHDESGQATSLVDMKFLHKIAEEFTRLLNLDDTQTDKPIDIKVTSDGLRITLYNHSKQPIFFPYSPDLTPWGDLTIQNLSWIMDRYSMHIRIDAFASKMSPENQKKFGFHDAFDLTALRANAVQKLLKKYGLSRPIDRVTGFGDAHPLYNTSPYSEKNDRIELSLVVT